MNNRKGFSLPEVLAVLVILGILLMIAVPSINRVKEEVEKKKIKGDAETFLALAKDYTESNAVVEVEPVIVTLSKVDKAKLNGSYDTKDSVVTGSNCSFSGVRYKCNNYKLLLISKDTPYKATKNEASSSIIVERK